MSSAEQANKGIDKSDLELHASILSVPNHSGVGKQEFLREMNWKLTARKKRFHKTKNGNVSKLRLRFPVGIFKIWDCFVFLVIFLRFPGSTEKRNTVKLCLTDPAVTNSLCKKVNLWFFQFPSFLLKSHLYFPISAKKITPKGQISLNPWNPLLRVFTVYGM